MAKRGQFPWPNGCRGAISLTYDDGLRSQLERAIPIMDKHGVQGTFYVNPRDGYERQLEPWYAVAETGHEIGNHTIQHACSKNFQWISQNERPSLEEMTWEDLEADIVESGRRIKAIIPQRERVSFAYPCYQPFIGRGETRRSYVPLVVKHCWAGRGRGERTNDPWYCDLGYVWSWPVERMTGAEMVGLVEQTVAEGGWGVLTFHGIQEGHLSVADVDLEELCAHLAANRERVWTAPLADVAEYVTPRQAW